MVALVPGAGDVDAALPGDDGHASSTAAEPETPARLPARTRLSWAALFARVLANFEALYDEDEETAQVDLPPRSGRVTRAEADDLMDFARMQLDLARRKVREEARAERLASRGRHRGFVRAAREALLARLAELQALHRPALQVAHRKLDTVGDDELATLVADLESFAAEREVADNDNDPDEGGA